MYIVYVLLQIFPIKKIDKKSGASISYFENNLNFNRIFLEERYGSENKFSLPFDFKQFNKSRILWDKLEQNDVKANVSFSIRNN